MIRPSDYELDAWTRLQSYEARPVSRIMSDSGTKFAEGAQKLGAAASAALEGAPRAKVAMGKGAALVSRGAKATGAVVRKGAEAVPDGVTGWAGSAVSSAKRSFARVARVGLSPEQVVAKYRKKGYPVERLKDVRSLDLQQIDKVRGKVLTWAYPVIAASTGAAAGLVITGGELSIPVSAGASAAPSTTTIAAAMVGDTTAILALSSRVVGQIALLYGYDPDDPAERLFIMTVINAGTAGSQAAKAAAFGEVSRLTQQLVRGAAHKVLDKAVITQASKIFAKSVGTRLTKAGLGKIVPLAGIAVGATFNWGTLESIVDAADAIYRRRFLLEKYPELEAEAAPDFGLGGATFDGPDDVITLLK